MVKVAVLGAAGGIGQPLSLLLKLNPEIKELSLYDIVNVHGVKADLSHINSNAKLTSHQGDAELAAALKGVNIVVIPAGVPRKPGMTRDDLFNINAGIVAGLAKAIAQNCPNATICVISNPVNSTVPIVAEILKKNKSFNPKKLFGVTTLDSVRASTFISEIKNCCPYATRVPIVGGHSGVTIVPLLSNLNSQKFSQDEVDKLTHRIQFGGDEVVKAKDGAGSATLSMAHAANRFVGSIIKSLSGQEVIEPAFINLESDSANGSKAKKYIGDCSYFAFDNGETKELIPFDKVNDHEKGLIAKAVEELNANVKKGVEFVNKL